MTDPQRGQLLRTWKEIGAYLKVSDRTARSWKSEGIPVYRQGKGERATVIAYSAELDAWVQARARRGTPRGRMPLAIGVAASIVLIVAASAWFGTNLLGSPWLPEHLRFTGEGIEILDGDGEVLRLTRAKGLLLEEYASIEKYPKMFQRPYLVRDVEQDGEDDVFVAVFRPTEENDEVWRIAPDGSILWEYSFSVPLEARGRVFSEFKMRIVDLVHSGGRPYLIVLGIHKAWYPSRLAFLDPATGERIGEEYSHPGFIHRLDLHDVDGDGVEEILIGGNNNPDDGDGHAYIALLDVPFREPAEGEVDFFGRPGHKETAYRLFPRLDLLEADRTPANTFQITVQNNERILAQVGVKPYYIEYVFDLQLNLVDAHIADFVKTHHAKLRMAGELDHRLLPEEEERWKTHVVSFPTAPDGNGEEVVGLMSGPD